MEMYPQKQVNTRKRKISEAIAIAAMIGLLTCVVDALVAKHSHGFLPMEEQSGGIFLGMVTTVLFFISFGFGFREKSRLTTLLLIAGGGLLVGFMLVAPTMGILLYLTLLLHDMYIRPI
jgi:hypothetical protein